MQHNFKTTGDYWRRMVFEHHPQIGWWHIPNLRARLYLGETYHFVETNSAGMRASQDYSPKKPKDKLRIAFLGDSYTAGDGVSNGKRFSDMFETQYNHIESLNFGLNSSGTDQQLLIFEEIASQYDADVYIWGICVENIARNLCHCRPSWDYSEHQVIFRPKPFFTLNSHDELELRNTPVPEEKRTKDNLGDWEHSFPYLHEKYPGDPYAIYREGDSLHWQIMKKIFQRFLRQVKGKTVLLVPLPMVDHYMQRFPTQFYMERFKELENKEHDVHVIDLMPALSSVHPNLRKGFSFPTDPHYTPEAHRNVFKTLEYALTQINPHILNPSSHWQGSKC